MRFYPDASLVMAAVLNEPSTGKAIDALTHQDADIVTSAWTLTDIASALGIKCRMGMCTGEERDRAFRAAQSVLDTHAERWPVTDKHCDHATRLIESRDAAFTQRRRPAPRNRSRCRR